jgi:hypothetical protein
LDLDFEDFNFEGHNDEEDLMYGANDYVEAPVPEQLEGGMDVDEPENDLEEENDLHQAQEVRLVLLQLELAYFVICKIKNE